MANATMTAGLLHDVGKLVLCSGRGDDYLELTQDAKNGSEPLWQLEQEALGTSHAEVGAYLLALWALPDAIVEVVAYHQQPATNGCWVTGSCSPPSMLRMASHTRARTIGRLGWTRSIWSSVGSKTVQRMGTELPEERRGATQRLSRRIRHDPA